MDWLVVWGWLLMIDEASRTMDEDVLDGLRGVAAA